MNPGSCCACGDVVQKSRSDRFCQSLSLQILPCAPVAQLDRAADFESAGREFESLRAYQLNQSFTGIYAMPVLLGGHIRGHIEDELPQTISIQIG